MEEGSYTFNYNYVDLRVWFEVSLNIYLIPPNISVKRAYARADIRRFTLFNTQRPIYVLDMFIYHRLRARHTLNTLKVRYSYVTRSLSIHYSYVRKDLSSIGGVLNLDICAYMKLVIWNVRCITISIMCIVCWYWPRLNLPRWLSSLNTHCVKKTTLPILVNSSMYLSCTMIAQWKKSVLSSCSCTLSTLEQHSFTSTSADVYINIVVKRVCPFRRCFKLLIKWFFIRPLKILNYEEKLTCTAGVWLFSKQCTVYNFITNVSQCFYKTRNVFKKDKRRQIKRGRKYNTRLSTCT